MKSTKPRKPRVVRLETPAVEKKPTENTGRKPRAELDLSTLVSVPDGAAQSLPNDTGGVADELTPPPAALSTKRVSFLKWFLAGLAGLVSLGLGLAIDQLVRDLFSRSSWLGWVAAGLTVIVVIAAFGLVIREIAGLMRARKIEKLRQQAKEALESGEYKPAGQLVDQLMDLYQNRPDTARGRAKMETHHGEIIDGPDLVGLAERDLIGPLDQQARELVMNAAKRVSLVTAISPRALVDLAYVAVENLRLIRQLSELYGGRPGTLGIFRLARNVVAHLAVTGSIAVGDGIIHQFIGQGLAAKLSARLGEGVVNGLLTARVGISAIDLCRPLPFTQLKRPGIGDFIGDLVSPSKSENSAEKPD